MENFRQEIENGLHEQVWFRGSRKITPQPSGAMVAPRLRLRQSHKLGWMGSVSYCQRVKRGFPEQLCM